MRFGFLAFLLATDLVFGLRATANPLRPALLDDDGYNETWMLSADGDGLYVQIVFGVANLGPGSGRASCRVVALTGAKPWRHQLIAGKGDWSYAAKPEPRLEMKGCTVRGGAATVIAVAVEEGAITVTLPAMAAAEERLRITNAHGAPRHRESLLLDAVTGHAVVKQLDSVREHAVTATLIHALSHEAPDEIAPQWIRVRARDEGRPLTALMLVGAAQTDAWLFESGRPAQHFTAPARRAAPFGAAEISFAAGATAPAFRSTAQRVDYEPLRELGLLGRVLGAIVGDPLVSVHEGLLTAGGSERRVMVEGLTFR